MVRGGVGETVGAAYVGSRPDALGFIVMEDEEGCCIEGGDVMFLWSRSWSARYDTHVGMRIPANPFIMVPLAHFVRTCHMLRSPIRIISDDDLLVASAAMGCGTQRA